LRRRSADAFLCTSSPIANSNAIPLTHDERQFECHIPLSDVGDVDSMACETKAKLINNPPTHYLNNSDEHGHNFGNESSGNDDSTFDDNISADDCVFTFQEKLAACFVQSNISHTQGNAILKVLREHKCLAYLPKNIRTLIGTPRGSTKIKSVPPGEYLHIGIVPGITQSLRDVPIAAIPKILEIDLSTDGASLDKSGFDQIWPIQYKIANIPGSKPQIIGIYRGKKKPNSATDFFQDLIDEFNSVTSNGGIVIKDAKKCAMVFRCFIADAPARAFILNHKGHMSFSPCSKCKITGDRVDNRTVFLGVNHSSWNDIEYIRRDDDHHHKDGESPLSHLWIGMVSQVPFESMHLVYLGVSKKILSALIGGQYSKRSKLSANQVAMISARLWKLHAHCPREFNRKPRPIEEFAHFKAIEYRQFMLYTGPVVMHGIVKDDVYIHFLLLHTTLRVLSSSSPSIVNLQFAKQALQLFVEQAEIIYGASFLSYNVHALLHLVDDVVKLGPLDSFSAFSFENNMRVFKRYCRKPHLYLQQIAHRIAEETNYLDRFTTRQINDAPVKVTKRYTGKVPIGLAGARQYSNVKTVNFTLGLQIRDHCCITRDGSICIISNIFAVGSLFYLIVRTFRCVEAFYDVGISSSSAGVFKCSALSTQTCRILLDDVVAKGYKMPNWQVRSNTFDSSSDDEEQLVNEQFIVISMYNNHEEN